MKKLSLIILAACAMVLAACQQKSHAANEAASTADTAKAIAATNATVLVLLAHPDITKSKANAALSKAAAEVEGVQVVNIYDYPPTADTYREAVTRAKTIVYEFPLYWMSSPHLLKQWTDEVFMTFVGEGIIKGKHLMVVTTTGSEEAAYQHGGRNKYTMDEYLRRSRDRPTTPRWFGRSLSLCMGSRWKVPRPRSPTVARHTRHGLRNS